MLSGRERLYLFVHLPKSAGSSFNKHAEKNIAQTKRLIVGPEMLNADRADLKNVIAKTKKYFGQLSTNEKESLSYVAGHAIFYQLHRYINQKKPFYFTFLREPAKRVVSLYNYYSKWYEYDLNPRKANNPLYKQVLLLNNCRPSFLRWYQKKYLPNKKSFPIPSTAAFLQGLGYLEAGKVTLETARKCWQKFSFVGLTETFDNDAAYLYHLLGFNKFFIKQNISPKYFSLKNNPRIYKLLKKDLATDYLLYDTAVHSRKLWIRKHSEYRQMVEEVKNRQRRLTPITQLLFDWPENLHTTSKILRQNLPLYGPTLDRLKRVLLF